MASLSTPSGHYEPLSCNTDTLVTSSCRKGYTDAGRDIPVNLGGPHVFIMVYPIVWVASKTSQKVTHTSQIDSMIAQMVFFNTLRGFLDTLCCLSYPSGWCQDAPVRLPDDHIRKHEAVTLIEHNSVIFRWIFKIYIWKIIYWKLSVE